MSSPVGAPTHLSPSQRCYLPEVVRGVWTTSRHFFSNLFIHALHALGLAKGRRATVTYQWPEERRPLPRRLRARHRIMKREDGSTRCVACMMCETVCPARCISIVAEGHPDPRVEKRPKSFEIDSGVCVYCGFCVEACPEDAIRMDTYDLETAAYSRADMLLGLDRLSAHDNSDLYPSARHSNAPGGGS